MTNLVKNPYSNDIALNDFQIEAYWLEVKSCNFVDLYIVDFNKCFHLFAVDVSEWFEYVMTLDDAVMIQMCQGDKTNLFKMVNHGGMQNSQGVIRVEVWKVVLGLNVKLSQQQKISNTVNQQRNKMSLCLLKYKLNFDHAKDLSIDFQLRHSIQPPNSNFTFHCTIYYIYCTIIDR